MWVPHAGGPQSAQGEGVLMEVYSGVIFVTVYLMVLISAVLWNR
jgi:hypothetical protein